MKWCILLLFILILLVKVKREAEASNAEIVYGIIFSKLIVGILDGKNQATNGTNKRVVQLLIQSRLSENQYPVKSIINILNKNSNNICLNFKEKK